MKVIFSSAEHAARTGDNVANGGVRMHNQYVDLLNRHGIDAYVCTFDGKYTPWLMQHAPHVSIEQVARWKDDGEELKFVTTWLASRALFEAMDGDDFYYLDGETKWTIRFERAFNELRPRIRKIAAISRYIESWHMAHDDERVVSLPCACDTRHWFNDPSARAGGRIGYMTEGPMVPTQIKRIADAIPSYEFMCLDCLNITDEHEEAVRNLMQTCDMFLGMSPSKDPLWGQGFGLTGLEAMHAGAVPIMFDTLGCREYLINGFNGYLVKEGNTNAVIDRILFFDYNPRELEAMRNNGLSLARSAFALNDRWHTVKEWLDL